MKCTNCEEKPRIKAAKTGQLFCAPCFTDWFEKDVHETIIKCELFKRNEKIAIGASGGKDSIVLSHIMKRLNDRYDYGLNFYLICIDEGIKGYRDFSIESVLKSEKDLEIPLIILSYKDLYGWTMDDIVAKIGKKNNCTFCGVFRRQALDRGAQKINANKLLTGHNADDLAETVYLNVLRGDTARLQRCGANITGSEDSLPRAKPLKYSYEKDIVIGNVRTLIKDLEAIRPRTIMDLIRSAEELTLKDNVSVPDLLLCQRCGYISSQKICKACLLLTGLEKDDPNIGITKKKKWKAEIQIEKESLEVDGKTGLSSCMSKDEGKSACECAQQNLDF
ncbi:Cytoplasmic tRNA 2-thiolation protein 1 [Strongyloides ratti]|uniref:Cytoplasmic tRNA 2-thiolation protein 1 n=1 Tax=Strongyloides ratti TaxID=34506 RepID=A0A090LFT9_STRRB|nr:Cytoplasmic tRNA 2-thiolation protein 1 [Strongyloides ratti]CEF67013.1 Cytoplasmic tRNA 2-thiolation protein 1 [Strongyloides ratti]